jgi:LysM repeat protein
MPILAENALKPDKRMQQVSQISLKWLFRVGLCLACAVQPVHAGGWVFVGSATLDSLSLEEREGSWMVWHEVEPGETLYGLARRYRSTVALILQRNPDVAALGLKAGQRVWIPRTEQTTTAAAEEQSAGEGSQPSGGGAAEASEANSALRLESPAPVQAGTPELASTRAVSPSARPAQESALESPSGAAPELPEFFWHELEPEETLFALSRMYGVSLSALLEANPGLDPYAMKNGQRLRIPSARQPLSRGAEPVEAQAAPAQPVQVEAQGSAVPAAARPTEPEHQGLATPYEPVTPEPEPAESAVAAGTANPPVAERIPDAVAAGTAAFPPSATLPPGAGSSAERPATSSRERGLATWIDATSAAAQAPHLFALYNGAPAGTLITVRNLMNNRSVQVKVVGPMPQTNEDSRAIVKLSKDAALQLQAHDAKVLVEVQSGSAQP